MCEEREDYIAKFVFSMYIPENIPATVMSCDE